jgi:hypothetical protein
MGTTLWVKIRSWHAVGKGGDTRCGRQFWADAPSAFDLPMGEKSCETCLRWLKRDEEKATA